MTGLTGRLLGHFDPDSDGWHAARQGRIGASDVGVICGWSPWQTRDDLLARKRGETESRPETKAQARGHYLEPAVISWFCDQTGLAVDPAASSATWVSQSAEWQLCNPDAVLTNGELLEVKTAKQKTVEHGWGRALTDQVPLLYAAQCQWAMHVTGARVCHLAVLFGSPFQFSRYKIKFDRIVVDYLIAHATDFYAEMTATHTDIEGIPA